jgi:hypothetical protein
VNVWIFVDELFNNLLIEPADEAHAEDRGKFPQVIATRVSATDGILVPLQGARTDASRMRRLTSLGMCASM